MIRVTLAIALLFATPTTAPQQTGVEATISIAETLFEQGDRAAALEMAERIVAGDPLNVEAHHLIQRIMRRHDEAAMLGRYQELARRFPSSPEAQYLYGNALLNARNAGGDAARAQFARALQLDPSFGWAATIQAAFAQARRNGDEALRLLADINVAEIRRDLHTATMYADLLRLNGLRDEAIRFLEQAVAVNPEDPRFLLELWRLRMRGVDDYQAERATFAWQVAANRDRFLASPELTAELARFYTGSAMADRDGARDLWLALANRFPGNPEAKNALLRAAGMTGDPESRFELYDRVLADYPDSAIRYEVYYRMLRDLIEAEQYERAEAIARRLTAEIDPGRPDDSQGIYERPTVWGFTLEGIGYAAWFAAAQAEAHAGRRGANLYTLDTLEQPISPGALTAARALDTSGCSDPRSLSYVAEPLLRSSYYRDLGLRLMERAERAASGADPLIELAYGTDALEETRRELERDLRDLPLFYALAGQTARAEQLVEQMLARIDAGGEQARGMNPSRTHFIAAKVFTIVGRWRDAARQYLLSKWYAPSLPRDMEPLFNEDLERIYAEIGMPAIERRAPGRGPRMPVMGAGLEPVEGAASLDAGALGGDLLLMVFWATWNEPAIAHVLALDALALQLEDPRLSTLAVAVQRVSPISRTDGLDRFARFRRDTELTIPMARAEVETVEHLDLIGLPTTILLDRTGRVLARQLGFGVDRGTWSQQWRAVVLEELARIEAARRPRPGRPSWRAREP